MEYQLVACSFQDISCKIEIRLYILRIGNVKDLILSEVIHLTTEKLRTEFKQVACRLEIGLERIRTIIIGIAESHFHDKLILVVVMEDHVRVGLVIQILFAECIADPRHEHIVQVDEIHAVGIMMIPRIPQIVPSGGKDTPQELRTCLGVEHKRQFTGGIHPPSGLLTQERHDESGERQARLNAILDEVLIAITLQSSDGLVGTTQLQTERLRTLEQVAVLVGQRGGSTKISRCVRTFWLETDC